MPDTTDKWRKIYEMRLNNRRGLRIPVSVFRRATELKQFVRNGVVVITGIVLTACGAPTDSKQPVQEIPPANMPLASHAGAACAQSSENAKSLFWGDVHVHTAYSLDAYGFGTFATPADAYQFARGEAFELAGETFRLSRPLDFVAVTDHAEWLDMLYICTNPTELNAAYCNRLRQNSSLETGSEIFRDYVVPTITQEKPAFTPICEDDPERCQQSLKDAWTRVQEQANSANDPCNFTALIGFEWSATPGYSHTHRNVIFRSDEVVPYPIDYIRYPQVAELWSQLDRHCKLEDGCDVITVPHSTNMGDGMSFDVETDPDQQLDFRARYERLIEIHQQKGGSECLSPYDERLSSEDCTFEQYLTVRSRPRAIEDFTEEEWEQSRQSYARALLLRGLKAFDASGEAVRNPLQLGFVGSTDAHSGVPGFVDEELWQGSVFSMGDFEKVMTRSQFNPGGLVGVWAKENTREAIFDALKRREVYGTSGPRIGVRFEASTGVTALSCDDPDTDSPQIVMGGQFSSAARSPQFRIIVQPDQTPLDRVEIIKGEWTEDGIQESRTTIWTGDNRTSQSCIAWRDPDFTEGAPAFWYPRILQKETPRWTEFLCRRFGTCETYPQAIAKVQERAWGSPIWYLPAPKD